MATNHSQETQRETSPETKSKEFVNKFVNDGSFLETFKRMQQQQQKSSNHQCFNQPESVKQSSVNHIQEDGPKSLLKAGEISNQVTVPPKDDSVKTSCNKIILGKRRNQKLKVGIIKRDRKEADAEAQDNVDAWAKYMREVRQYKEKYGDDSDKKRPLVK